MSAGASAPEELDPRARGTYEKELAKAYPYYTVQGTFGLWSKLPLSDTRPVDTEMDAGPLGATKPADVYELVQLDRHTDRVLPNGYCLLPPPKRCDRGNACLTCDHFATDARHRTFALIRKALWWRGEIGPEVIAYLVKQIERSFTAAETMARRLDQASMARSGPITIKLARDLLSGEDS